MHETPKTFGEFLKNRRQEARIPLRQFCRERGLDPGTYCKYEKGAIPPPTSSEKRAVFAQKLGLKAFTDEWRLFMDLAAIGSGRLPPEIVSDAEIAQKLPLLFRNLRGEKLTLEEMYKLVELIRNSERRQNDGMANLSDLPTE